ncbi:MAG TPA: SulP family inorganic anion transporter [Acidimicrobiales bacterium]|nr:SulP family inorganic anion transporter [Acidimicrobiales bacterium]
MPALEQRIAASLGRLVLPSLRGFQRSWLRADAIAGITLLAIAVPEQLATARLAGVHPISGLYAFVAGTVAFALLGTNPQLSVGADSTIAPLFAVGVAHLAPLGSARYIELVAILAVMVGILVSIVGLARLGWIAEFLSRPIIAGFLSGVGLVVIIRQLPDLFGIPASTGSNLARLGSFFEHVSNLNGWATGIGLVVFLVIMGVDRLDRRIPAALFGMVASTVIVAGLDLRAHGVAVLGHVSHAVPHFGLVGVSWSAIGRLAPIAGVVALVVVSQSAVTTRAFAEQGGYSVDVNRDFVGIGAGSILAGISGSFPVNASPARTAVLAAASGRSQLAGLGAASTVILLVPATGLLKDVPLAALAGTLLYVASRLFRFQELIAIARFSLVELGLAIITLLTVTLVGVEQGIGVAVGLAILDRARVTARPKLHVLGRIVGTTSWTLVDGPDQTEQVEGVLVVLFAAPLWYANAAHFQAQFVRALANAGRPVRRVVLDAAGMSDIDYTGSKALAEVIDRVHNQHIEFFIARAGGHAQQSLDRSGLMNKIGVDYSFAAVDQAVTRE